MLPKRLKERRKILKLNQEDVAEKLGITRQGYGHYETGRNEPDNETLSKLSNILQCTSDYLLGRSDHPHYTAKEQEEKLDQDLFKKLVEMYKEGRLTKEDMDKINEYAEFVTSNKEKK